MWLKTKLIIITSALSMIFPVFSYGQSEVDFIEKQREIKLLEMENEKAELQKKQAAVTNEIPGSEQRFRRQLSLMQLEVQQQALINQRQKLLNELSAMQPQLPAGQMFLWGVSGVDGELSGTIIQIVEPEKTEQAISGVAPLESFKAKEGHTLPNGWTVTKINLDGAELTREGETVQIGLLYSNVVL